MSVILETSRLLFRAHELEDIDAYCAMEADPEVRRYVGGAPRPREQAETRFRQGLSADISDHLSLWATLYKPENCYIGRCGIYPHFGDDSRPIPGEGVLAFYIARPYWGRGLATEAGEAFLRFGFEELGLDRIVATVQDGNDASTHVLEKLGLHLIRTEQGQYRVFHHFEITRT